MPFEPTAHGFKVLDRTLQSVRFYELDNNPRVNGKTDFLRLNVYLSRDGEFVTVWYGLFDPIIAEAKLQSVRMPDDMHLHESYDEPLFRGYISSDDDARVIFSALRISRYAPNMLSADADNKLQCTVA